MLAAGTILQERYRIVGKLGEGGMGAVYEAVDQRLDATVALKETLFVDERLRRQFEREARLLARLHHAALPRVSDHFTEGGGEFLVMQYVPGDDLAAIMAQRRSPFPEEQVALWADQLLDALDYLHTQDPQIVHRDIKPQNLKLTGRGQIVLLDFGLAKGQVHELSLVTASASIFGYTPNYAPLEQVQGLGTDPRSDLYALAATLYNFATSIKPPDALTRAASIVNGESDPLQPADQVNPALSRAFAAVLQRAMAQNRDQRYANAAEMRKALHSGLDQTIRLGGDAPTAMFPPASTQIVVANPTVPERATDLAAETTLLRAAPVAAKKQAMPWVIAGVVVILAITGVGAFYAVQRNRDRALMSQPLASPSPVISVQVAQPSPTAPAANSIDRSKSNSAQEKPVSPAKETKKQEPAKKREKTDAEEEAEQDKQDSREARDERAKAKAAAESPEAPEPPDRSGELPRRNGDQRRMNPVITKTRQDGAKVMITPDGTRIVTFPNGTVRVLPPLRRGRRRP